MELWDLVGIIGPIIGGLGLGWVASKCRGRNAKNAFKFASVGTWLLLLRYLSGFGGFAPITWVLLLVPSIICYYLSAHWIMREMRAQQKGEYTERA